MFDTFAPSRTLSDTAPNETFDWHGCCIDSSMEALIASRPSDCRQSNPLAADIGAVKAQLLNDTDPIHSDPNWQADALAGSLSSAIGIEAALIV